METGGRRIEAVGIDSTVVGHDKDLIGIINANRKIYYSFLSENVMMDLERKFMAAVGVIQGLPRNGNTLISCFIFQLINI